MAEREKEPDAPLCDLCGAPVTTGMMVLFCPRRRQCEFFVPEFHADTVEWIEETWAEQDASRLSTKGK